MPASDPFVFSTSHWVWVGVAWLLVLLAAGVIGWGLFWDRSRGRARCPKCWYDLTGAVDKGSQALKCPECGHTARHAGELFKTRRRIRGAWVAALPLLAAQVLWNLDRIKQEGWPGAVPTPVLAAGVSGPDPDVDAKHSARFLELRGVLDERHHRGEVGPLGAWIWRTKLRAVFACAGRLGAGAGAGSAEHVLCVYDARSLLDGDWGRWSIPHCNLDSAGPTYYQIPMGDRVKGLRDLITGNIAPEDWIDNGGDVASIDVLDRRVVVVAPPGHQDRLAKFFGLLHSPTTDRAAMGEGLETAIAALTRLSGAIVDFPSGSITKAEAVECVRRQTGVAIEPDWDALQAVAVRKDDPFRAAARRQMAIFALDRAIALPEPWQRPSWTVRDGVVKIGTRSGLDGALLAVYDAADFRERDPTELDPDVYKQVQDIVTGCVATEDWVDNGGDRASVMWWRSKMVIRAGPRIHMEVQGLLAKMRAAHGNLGRPEESSAP
jgi:hypothetical protein